MLPLLLACAEPEPSQEVSSEKLPFEFWNEPLGCSLSFDPERDDRWPIGLDEPLPDVGLTARQLLAMQSGMIDATWFTKIRERYASERERISQQRAGISTLPGPGYLDPETLLLELSVGALWWVSPKSPPVLPEAEWPERRDCPAGWLDTDDVIFRWREPGTGQLVAEATAQNPVIPQVGSSPDPIRDSISIVPSEGRHRWFLSARLDRWGGRCGHGETGGARRFLPIWRLITEDVPVPEALRAELPPTPPGWTGTWVCNTTLFGPPSEPGPRADNRW